MILITIYREPSGKKENREFARLQDAIHYGQGTGAGYEVYDPSTGRVIDWNEVNAGEDDGWYYDDRELVWKRCSGDDPSADTQPHGFRFIRDHGYSRQSA